MAESKKLHRCCFTGHRPDKLMDGAYDCTEEACAYLDREIDKAIADGFRTFITGMCPGIDVLAGEIVLAKKATHPEIRLIAAMPYPRFAFNWEGWGDRVRSLAQHADYVYCVSPRYTGKSVFQTRNEFMVDHSARLIAYWDGTPGGTWNTIRYARTTGIDIKYN